MKYLIVLISFIIFILFADAKTATENETGKPVTNTNTSSTPSSSSLSKLFQSPTQTQSQKPIANVGSNGHLKVRENNNSENTENKDENCSPVNNSTKCILYPKISDSFFNFDSYVNKAFVVLVAVTVIIILYFLIRMLRLRRRNKKRKTFKKKRMTKGMNAMEMQRLEEGDGDEDEDDWTVFDATKQQTATSGPAAL